MAPTQCAPDAASCIGDETVGATESGGSAPRNYSSARDNPYNTRQWARVAPARSVYGSVHVVNSAAPASLMPAHDTAGPALMTLPVVCLKTATARRRARSASINGYKIGSEIAIYMARRRPATRGSDDAVGLGLTTWVADSRRGSVTLSGTRLMTGALQRQPSSHVETEPVNRGRT